MRLLKTKLHGFLDLPIGIHLVGLPLLSELGLGYVSNYVPMVIGSIIILYSLFTDYEFGIGPLSMRKHLMLDVIIGTVLAFSPWIFGFSEVIFYPHLLSGIFIVGLGVITNTKAGVSQNRIEALGRILLMQKTY